MIEEKKPVPTGKKRDFKNRDGKIVIPTFEKFELSGFRCKEKNQQTPIKDLATSSKIMILALLKGTNPSVTFEEKFEKRDSPRLMKYFTFFRPLASRGEDENKQYFKRTMTSAVMFPIKESDGKNQTCTFGETGVQK